MHLDPSVLKTYWTKDEDEKVQKKRASPSLTGMRLMSHLPTALTDSRTSEKVWHNKLDPDFHAHEPADGKAVS